MIDPLEPCAHSRPIHFGPMHLLLLLATLKSYTHFVVNGQKTEWKPPPAFYGMGARDE